MTDRRVDVSVMDTVEAGGRTSWRRRSVTFVAMAMSVALLVTLYRSIDMRLVFDALIHADPLWLAISVGMILPITFLRAVRFYWVAPQGSLPGLGEAMRLTLVSSALNVFLPAKAGDLIKSYFVATRSNTAAGVALSIVVYERLCDVFGLIAWCLVGWVVGRPRIDGVDLPFWELLAVLGATCAVLIMSERAARFVQWGARTLLPGRRLKKLHDLAEGWPGLLRVLGGRRRWIVSYSLALWLMHLFQIWLFTVALRVDVPFTVSASLSAVALIAGQIPLTFAGLGARDVVLVVLLARYMSSELAAAMGVLISTRNLLPPLLGLPIMRPYLSSAVDDARAWRQKVEQGR